MTEILGSAVLFDLDGVLIDSTSAEARVGRAAEHGVNLKKVIGRVHDRRRPATMREYLPSADHAENRAIEPRETQGASAITTLPGHPRIAAVSSEALHDSTSPPDQSGSPRLAGTLGGVNKNCGFSRRSRQASN